MTIINATTIIDSFQKSKVASIIVFLYFDVEMSFILMGNVFPIDKMAV